MVMDGDKEERTLWVGNLSSKVTEELLYELFLQAGPLVGVTIPKDANTGKARTYAFVEFKHACSVPYTIQLMNGIQLQERSLRLQCRTGSKHASPAHGGVDSPTATPTHQPQFPTPNPPQLQRAFTTPLRNPPQGFNHLLGGFPTPMTPGAGLMPTPMGMPMMNSPHMAQQMQRPPMSHHRPNHNNMGQYSPMDTPHRGSRDRDHRERDRSWGRDQRGWSGGRDADYRGRDYQDRSRDRDNRRDSRHYQHRR